MGRNLSEPKEAEYNLQVRDFFHSDAWREYLMPMIGEVLQKELPSPSEPGWEERYRKAYALSEAFTLIINTITNVAGKEEFKKKAEAFLERSIDQA